MSNTSSTAPTSADKAALFLRLFIGALLFTEAITKSQQYPWLEQEYPTILGIGGAAIVSIVGILEVIAGVLISIGLFTRATATIMAIVMFFAAFFIFPQQTFSQGELKFVYTGIYITLAIGGGGRYALDEVFLPSLRKRYNK